MKYKYAIGARVGFAEKGNLAFGEIVGQQQSAGKPNKYWVRPDGTAGDVDKHIEEHNLAAVEVAKEE